MESLEAATLFAALSVEARLNALRLLLAAGPPGMAAGDLAARLALPPSTTSFHVAALERAGLTRSARQGRQIIHAARIAGLRKLFGFVTETCCGGRPELCDGLTRLLPPWQDEEHGMMGAFNVLFLCTHNSARSIMAEAILRKQGGERFRAFSAGSEPLDRPNPEVMAKLRALGHDVEGLRSKSWNEFSGPSAPPMDFVIILCDTPHGQVCPDFGGLAVSAAWPLPDPSKFAGSEVERAALLNELYASLRRRIDIFVSLPFASLGRAALRARLDELARCGLPAPAEAR
jgi:protein-tyrosine-phosphatase/DNA-binding transcriptional ArsR family regulator